MTEDNTSGEIREAAAPEVNAGSTNQESQMVPLDALQAERRERQQLQEELRALRDHVTLMANRTQETKKDEMDGASDDEILTVGQAKKYINQLDSNYRSSIQEIRFSQENKDYEEVIQKYLPEVLKEKPRLKETLSKSQDFELAYHLAKNSDAYRRSQVEKQAHPAAQKIMQNTSRPGNLSQVGSTAPANSAKPYRQMTDTEFLKEVQKNLGYA